MLRKTRLMVSMAALALVLAVVPAQALDNVIYNGSDLWMTPADGSTYAEFKSNPIPAGFFCNKSEPFTGRIAFKGAPLATADRSLGNTDTIVQRMDDAVFNKRGVASTRIQVRALQFESLAPVKTACGSFRVFVRLQGEQPVTRMKIVRESENGGRFFSPIAVNVRMSFVPVNGKGRERLEVTRSLRFKPSNHAFWAVPTEQAIEKRGVALVDTDSDGRPDTYVPGTSNFAAGWRASQNKEILSSEAERSAVLHDGYEHYHYTYPSETADTQIYN
ncbi:MAG TPA: hypothetical protein VEL74_12145 [Thermoanaerobaculia bacterium]|nr:hypothetical protein [Thermoanaerobaculia bacterium]